MQSRKTRLALGVSLVVVGCGDAGSFEEQALGEPEIVGEQEQAFIAQKAFSVVTSAVRTSLTSSEGNLNSGALDWIHFTSPTTQNGGSFDGFKNLQRQGKGAYGQVATGPLAFSWVSGSPTSSSSDNRSHIRACGADAQLSFDVPAVTRGRTLRVFVGAHNAAANMDIWLTNTGVSSQPAVWIKNEAGAQFGYYDVTYTGAAAGTLQVVLRPVQAGQAPLTANSCVSLLAARVTDTPNVAGATVSTWGILPPAFENNPYNFAVNVTHPQGVRGFELFYDNKLVGSPVLSDGGSMLVPIKAGPGKLHVEVTSKLGTSYKSDPYPVVGWYQVINTQTDALPDLSDWVVGNLTARTPLAGRTVKGAIVRVSLDHTYVGDLELKLISPNNKEVMLMKNRGGGAADLFYATFRDDARTSIANASGPFNSEYQPEQPLSAMIGEPFVGSQPWRIAIKDDYASDFGHVWKRELYLLLD